MKTPALMTRLWGFHPLTLALFSLVASCLLVWFEPRISAFVLIGGLFAAALWSISRLRWITVTVHRKWQTAAASGKHFLATCRGEAHVSRSVYERTPEGSRIRVIASAVDGRLAVWWPLF